MAGMLWSKQHYCLYADRWLEEHKAHPFDPESRHFRNKEWFHMINDHIISMPDKWEYPWYAAWDLAFHAIALSTVDMDFAKEQLGLMLREIYMHPNSQIPAYEWVARACLMTLWMASLTAMLRLCRTRLLNGMPGGESGTSKRQRNRACAQYWLLIWQR